MQDIALRSYIVGLFTWPRKAEWHIMEWTIIETPFFARRRDDYFANDEAFRQFQLDLIADPLQGDPIQGSSGLRKIREGDISRGRGKRGGFRIIYLQIPETREIYLFHIYPKIAKDDLDREEVKALAALAREYKRLAIVKKRLGR